MKLYLLSQTQNGGYDTYDSCVVVAENEEDAIRIHPGGYQEWNDEVNCWCYNYGEKKPVGVYFNDWATELSRISCVEIGEANEEMKPGLVISSFNAG